MHVGAQDEEATMAAQQREEANTLALLLEASWRRPISFLYRSIQLDLVSRS